MTGKKRRMMNINIANWGVCSGSYFPRAMKNFTLLSKCLNAQQKRPNGHPGSQISIVCSEQMLRYFRTHYTVDGMPGGGPATHHRFLKEFILPLLYVCTVLICNFVSWMICIVLSNFAQYQSSFFFRNPSISAMLLLPG